MISVFSIPYVYARRRYVGKETLMIKLKRDYKTQSQVKPIDSKQWNIKVKGNIVDSLPLKYSKEVKLSPLKREGRREILMNSGEAPQNRPSARRSKDGKRTTDKGIHLYRHWFLFLKLALELEELNAEIVTKNNTWIKNITNPNEPIPQSVIDRSIKERHTRLEGQHSGTNPDQIFRCKILAKIKVDRMKYVGWDLDKVLTETFNDWWKTHSHLFEGYYPTFIEKKNEWVDDPNFVYLRIDKTSQWGDVKSFMEQELSKRIKTEGRPRYKIGGKNPRTNTIQNNFNALVLTLKGWKPKDICTHKNIYLRRTDESMDANRTKGDRLTVSKGKGYSPVVSEQRVMGIHHLLEVCEGRFGSSSTIL
jgi:hypothetical protein